MSRLRSSRHDRVPFGLVGGLGVVALVVVLGSNGSYAGLVISTGMGFAIVVAGMVLQLGYSNQLAFSQSIFMGVGAYGVAILETRHGFDSAEALVVTVALAGVVALVLGSIITRAPGIALALATLLLPFICYELATESSYLGRFQGVTGVALLWNASSYASSLVRSGIVVALLLAVATFIVVRVQRSGTGVQLEAMGRNLALAEGVGVDTRRRSIQVFVLASMLAALGGAVVVSFQGLATPDIVAQPAELTLLVMFFLGGRRSILGSIVVAVAFEYLSVSVKVVSVNLLIIDGLILLVVLVAEPDGLGGLVRRLGMRGLQRIRGRNDDGPRPDAEPVARPEHAQAGRNGVVPGRIADGVEASS